MFTLFNPASPEELVIPTVEPDEPAAARRSLAAAAIAWRLIPSDTKTNLEGTKDDLQTLTDEVPRRGPQSWPGARVLACGARAARVRYAGGTRMGPL